MPDLKSRFHPQQKGTVDCGITIREYIAAQVLASIPLDIMTDAEAAKKAVKRADALMRALLEDDLS